MRVLSLIQAIGIYKEQVATDIIYHLALVFQSFPKADRRIGFHLQESALVAIAQYGGIMTCITEIELAGTQVHHTEKHGNKHAVVVMLAQFGIQLGSQLGRRVVTLNHSTEQPDNLSHEERCGHSLT